VESAAEILAAKGYEVETADLPLVSEITEAYGRMMMTEFCQNLPMLEELLGPGGRKYIEFAMEFQKPVDLPGYLELTALRRKFQREWALFFQRCPLVLGPVFTREIVPPDFGIRGIDEYQEVARALRLCSASSFIGVPAVAVPTMIEKGVPRGVQILSGMYREDLCLEAAAVIESAVGVFTPIDPLGV
jgi:amidase